MSFDNEYSFSASRDRAKAFTVVGVALVLIAILVGLAIKTPNQSSFAPAADRTVIGNIKDQANELKDDSK